VKSLLRRYSTPEVVARRQKRSSKPGAMQMKMEGGSFSAHTGAASSLIYIHRINTSLLRHEEGWPDAGTARREGEKESSTAQS
jgi:hypothetical protein